MVRGGAVEVLALMFARFLCFRHLRTGANCGIMDALGLLEVRWRSAAGVQTMWSGPWKILKTRWANSSTEEFRVTAKNGTGI